MDRDSGVIAGTKFRTWLRPDGVVHLTWASQVEIGLEDAIEAIQAMTELTGGRRTPLLVDPRGNRAVARSARRELAGCDSLASAVALIVGSPLSRMMGEFFLTVNKPRFPMRLFGDEGSAVTWLETFVVDHGA